MAHNMYKQINIVRKYSCMSNATIYVQYTVLQCQQQCAYLDSIVILYRSMYLLMRVTSVDVLICVYSLSTVVGYVMSTV